MSDIYDVIIIGGGPGGYTAALYAARANHSVLLLEKVSPGGQMGIVDFVENYPGFPEGINGFDLAMKMKASADKFGVETRLSEVKEVDFTSPVKEIKTSKEAFLAKTVIIATGADPRRLGLPREDFFTGRGLSYCATCDGMFYKDKEIAVVGGGNSASEETIYLSKICKKVYLIHRREELRASPYFSEAVPKLPNVEILWNTEVKAFLGEDKLDGIHLVKTSGEEYDLPVAGLFVAIGRVPVTDIFKSQLRIDDYGYIIADETTRTNIPGVFAVGDVRTKMLRQIVTATADGAIASAFVDEYMRKLP